MTSNDTGERRPRSRSRQGVRLLVWGILLAVTISAGFVWGVAFHRYHVFPYSLVKHRFANSEAVFRMERKFRTWKSAMARTHFRKDINTEDIVTASPTLDLVQSIPYVSGTVDSNPGNRGVTTYDRDRASDGLNFYVSGRTREILLIDMDGSLVHRWTSPVDDPREAVLFPNGDVIVITDARGLIKLDKRSNTVWEIPGNFHHGVTAGTHADVWTLFRKQGIVPEVDRVDPISIDSIKRISLDGEELLDLPVHELLLNSPYWFLLPNLGDRNIVRAGGAFDVLHTNWVEELDGSLEDRNDLYRRGNLLVSIRNICTVMIVDPVARKILWIWGPTNLTLQHNPRITPEGNVLILDNGIVSSRIVEVDPLTRSIEWQYAPPNGVFYTDTRGHCQRLPNGNTLITESNTGYAFEVTPSGETVWQFANPDIGRGGFRYMIDEMERYDREAVAFVTAR